MGILEKIRQRPENQKKIISLVSAAVITLIIVFIWYGYPFRSTNTNSVEANNDKLSSVSPFQVIKDEFSKAFTSSKSIFGEAASSTANNTVEVIEASTTLQASSTIN